MKKSYLLGGIVIVIFITALVLRLSGPEDTWICESGRWEKHGHPSSPQPESGCPAGTNFFSESNPPASSTIPVAPEPQATFADEIMILNPKQNQLVISPLRVEGQALGTWFFEASLPVKLVDSNNNLIVAHYGTALDDWMTEKPVKFSADLVFETAATSGYLVVAKDNPSGLAQNDASIKVPVRFK